MKSVFGIDIAILALCALVALFSEPIGVAHAKPVPPTPATCTIDGQYYIDRTTPVDTLIPSATASGDCAVLPMSCSFVFSSRIGDIGDWFAICQGATSCNAYTTISVDATVTSFPMTDQPQVISFCSTDPVGDATCVISGGSKGCPGKEVDCFDGPSDTSCSASKKLGGGIKGTFVCILNLPEPGLDVPDGATVFVTANCELS